MSAETVTAAALANDNLPTAPAPAVPAPAAPPAPAGPAEPPPATAGTPAEVDSYGRPFDPQKFAPRKDRKGRWINKNAGRPPKSAHAAAASGKSYVAPDPAPAGEPSAPAGPAGGPAPAPAAPQSDRFDLAAEIYARAGYSVLDGLFSGDGEWLPESDGEHVAFRGALAAYLRHKGTDDLPPGAAFALAAATYAGKRITKPRTLSRLRLFSWWLRSKIYAWRTGRSLDDLPPPAPPAPAAAAQPLPPQNLPPADSASAVRP